MDKEKFKPVSFSDEIVNEKDFVENQISRKAPVGPGSGSGSGSGGSSPFEGFGSGGGTIGSKYGGYWDVDCSFRYSLQYSYIIENGEPKITWASAQLTNVDIDCKGVPTTPIQGGVFFVPQPMNLLYLSMQSKDEDFVGSFDEFAVYVPTPEIVGPDGFRVEEMKREGDKDELVTTHYESKTLILKLFFDFNKNIDNTLNVTFGKCEVS